MRIDAPSFVLLLCLFLGVAYSQNEPTIVYRADRLSPDDLKLQRKFLPRGEDGTRPNQLAPSISLYNHVSGTVTGTSRHDSGYVSTTTSLAFARRFLQLILGGRGYIYRIHVSGNFVDAAASLRQFYIHTDEAEFAALGGIHYTQVLGWTEFRQGVERTEVCNRDYDRRFDLMRASGGQPQLAGFPPNHRAWALDPWTEFADCKQSSSRKRHDEADCQPKKTAVAFALDFLTELYLEHKYQLYNCGQDKFDQHKGDRKKVEPIKVVFYGDYVWPAEAKKQRGFLPTDRMSPDRNPEEDDRATIDWSKVIVPTFLTFGSAAQRAADMATQNTKDFSGVVYAVHATPNIINSANMSAAIGGIRWSQVLGWMQVPKDYKPSKPKGENLARMQELFQNAFQENTTLFKTNADYKAKYDPYTTTVDNPQDFSSIADIKTFMENNGKAVGWNGGFPLFEAGVSVTSKTSRKAKAENKIPSPHEPDTLDKIWSFIKRHKMAIALLPVVAASNFIPGVGEVADAAEAAALSTEGFEMYEAGTALSEASPLINGASKLKIL
ncbi:hypothetical protein QQS21_002297 [Conoideocrella luteorostrata]|uniref:Enterotoxin n=1 Tax=Conoideocrella luteorostrata TaxID=1105319 RepID=A0AAJ0G1D1_9HYPO|nr:hypothetical protein QQS21_002297 [Conoideocrella luteorostrata]